MKFAQELERLLARRQMRQAELAEAIGVSQTQVSRWLAGLNHPERGAFAAICTALSSDPADHAALLAGRLEAQRDLPGGELVTVTVDVGNTMSDAPRAQTALERAERYLHGEARKRSDVRDLVIDLARCLGYLDAAGSADDIVRDAVAEVKRGRRRYPKTAE